MLLTKKTAGAAHARPHLVHGLQRGLAQAIPTMDRRAFLRRSGLGVGVGIAASQLTLVKKARAAEGRGPAVGEGKIEVRRTVCTHCSVGCAIDAVVVGAWAGVAPLLIAWTAHLAVGLFRHVYDTRAFTLVYADLAADLVERQRAQGADAAQNALARSRRLPPDRRAGRRRNARALHRRRRDARGSG